MLHAEARRDAQGEFVPLAEQDPRRWDPEPIEEAEVLLLRPSGMGPIDRCQLEAAVQSVHAPRRLTGKMDWWAITRLYEALPSITGSPVVALNRAVALVETEGACAGLAALSQLDGI